MKDTEIKAPIANPFTNFPVKKTGELVATTSSVIPTMENMKPMKKVSFRPILSANHPEATDPITALL